jgi:hypothetical protein
MSSSITLLHHNRSKDGINLDQPAKVSTKAIIIILQLRELILEQASINESISKKLAFNDKMLEGINAKLDNFSSVIKEQIVFNKKI